MMTEKEFKANHKNLVNLINIHRNAVDAYHSMSEASVLFQSDPKVNQSMTNMKEVLDSTFSSYNDALDNILSSNNIMVINEVNNKNSFITFLSEEVLEKLRHIDLSNEDIAKLICDTLSKVFDQILEKNDNKEGESSELKEFIQMLLQKRKEAKQSYLSK